MKATRAAALRLATAALVSVPTHPAIAWCGKPYPPYAYQLPWFEFQAGSTPVRIIGDNRPESTRRLSPILVLPSPGLSYEYMENLEAFTVSERRVCFAALSAPATVAQLAAQARAALDALEAPGRAHVVAHGAGAVAALALASAAPSRVASLVLVSPFATADDLEPAARDAGSSRPLLASASTSGRACVDAVLQTAGAGASVGAVLAGAAPPGVAALAEPAARAVPALVVRGSRGDVSSAATASALLAALPRATAATFDASGPLPFVDEDERFREAALNLFDAADGVATRRAVMGGKGGVEVMS